jgi:phage gp37-like protein
MRMVSRIENAMVAALIAAATAFRVDTIESYGGQLDDEAVEWVRRLPAIWVVFAGAEKPVPYGTSKNKWKYTGTFTVFCGQRNLAGNKALRQGDANNPGVYALMQLTNAALLNKDLGLEIGLFEPGPIKPVSSFVTSRDSVMVYAMNWTTAWVDTAEVPELLPSGELVHIGLSYFLKPGDEVADAADLVTTTV